MSFTTGGPGASIGRPVAQKITTSVVDVAQDHYNDGVIGKGSRKTGGRRKRSFKRKPRR